LLEVGISPKVKGSTPFVLLFLAFSTASVEGEDSDLFRDKNEFFFTYLLTEKVSCGMIGRAWIIPAVGMRMQRRRLPLGLLSR
jgi:hypothetical protein